MLLSTILERTPHWVWGLLIALIALGLSMAMPRSVTLRRATLPSLALLLFSLQGVVGTFSHQPLVWFAWLACAAAATLAGQGRLGMQGTRFDAATGRLHMPGSFVPLALFLTLFVLKFGVGIAVAMDASLTADAGFAVTIGALYGMFSGLFLSRAATAWLLARRTLASAATLAV